MPAFRVQIPQVTHAPHFALLRERMKFQRGRYAPYGRKKGKNAPPGKIIDRQVVAESASDDRDFVFLEIEMLRVPLR